MFIYMSVPLLQVLYKHIEQMVLCKRSAREQQQRHALLRILAIRVENRSATRPSNCLNSQGYSPRLVQIAGQTARVIITVLRVLLRELTVKISGGNGLCDILYSGRFPRRDPCFSAGENTQAISEKDQYNPASLWAVLPLDLIVISSFRGNI